MSSFILSPKHTVIVAILAHAPGIVDTAQIAKTARILRSMNNATQFAQYSDSPVALTPRQLANAIPSALDWIKSASAADLSKVVQCFAYQCDEAPNGHKGRAILASVQNRVYSMPGAGGPSGIWVI